jgi:hypothetical protein
MLFSEDYLPKFLTNDYVCACFVLKFVKKLLSFFLES